MLSHIDLPHGFAIDPGSRVIKITEAVEWKHSRPLNLLALEGSEADQPVRIACSAGATGDPSPVAMS